MRSSPAQFISPLPNRLSAGLFPDFCITRFPCYSSLKVRATSFDLPSQKLKSERNRLLTGTQLSL
jgi:hypothetical protein